MLRWQKVVGTFVIISIMVILLVLEFAYSVSSLSNAIIIPFVIFRGTIGSLALFVFLLIYSSPNKDAKLGYLIAAGIMFLTAYTLETLSFLLANSGNSDYYHFSSTIFNFSQFLITMAPVTFMYYVVTYFKRTANLLVFLPVFIDIAIETLYQPIGLTSEITSLSVYGEIVNYWVYSPPAFWINVVYYLSISWLVFYLMYLVYQSRKENRTEIVVEQQNIFLLGIITVFIISPLVFYLNNFITNEVVRFYWISIVGRSILVLGLAIFIITFYRSSEKIDFFQPQPLDAFFILNSQTGEILYSKKFKSVENWDILEEIVTNVTIINKMLSDALGINSLMTSLDFIDRQLFIETDEQKELISILIVKYETSIIQTSFKSLQKELVSLESFDPKMIDMLISRSFRV